MKKIIGKIFQSGFIICLVPYALCFAAHAAAERPAVVHQQVMPSAIRGITTDKSSAQPIVVQPLRPVPSDDRAPEIDTREHEREACMRNNMGMGNTFVWASRYSNTDNYATMIEDVDNPENNICWVKVEIKSADAKISVADIAPKYFEMGRGITCGSWVDADMMRKRILDARRSGRTWGTIAGAVGGAGVGVGAMELFGNRLIGGDVMGQKELSGTDLIKSQLLAARQKGELDFVTDYIGLLRELRAKCQDTSTETEEICRRYSALYSDKDLMGD